jgi:hypothetical protein
LGQEIPVGYLCCVPRTGNAFWSNRYLLYLLRFEHDDNLGAYRNPPETGLRIPSGFAN